MNDIIINLDKEGYVFSNDEIIHATEIHRVEHLIGKFVESITNHENRGEEKKLPLDYRTILINGPRGSGKTSFLYSLFGITDTAERDIIRDYKLCFLGHLDPTMIEEKAHIFLLIIAMIKQKVYEKIDLEDDIHTKQRWNSLLEKLAKGLPVLNVHKKDPDFWDDASQIMHKGLDETFASYNIRKNFNALVEYSLTILCKKAFILTIDDVDTDFSKTIPLLEALRKYLNVEKIITVVSGDLDLFSLSIRKYQLENMGDKLVNADSISHSVENRNYILKNIAELENQYIKKIFPSQYQIHLKTVKQISEMRNIKIVSGKKENVLLDFYKKILASCGMYNSYQRSPFHDLLENLPLRTQIQFMKLYVNFLDEEIQEPYMWNKNNDDKMSLMCNTRISEIYNLFITELHYKNINLDNMEIAPQFVIISIMQLLVREQKLDELYQIQPISNDFTLNCCLTALSMIFSLKLVDSKDLFFDYLIRIGYLRNLKTYFLDEMEVTKTLSIEGLIKHANMENNRDLRQMSCYIAAYVRSLNETGKFSGIVTLLGFASKSRGSQREKENRFDFVVDSLPPYSRLVACLPLSISKPASKDNTINEYSIWTLIAVIGDIIREVNAAKFDSRNSTEYTEIIRKSLERQAQIRQFPMVNIKGSSVSNSGTDDDIDLQGNDMQENTEIIELEKKIKDEADFYLEMMEWLEMVKTVKYAVAPYVIAKIATRLFYSFENIRKNYQGFYLGNIMHLFVCQLCHAVIIEEVQELNVVKEDIQINNIELTTSLFNNNLSKISALLNEGSLPLSKIILTCPIFLMFMNFDDIVRLDNVFITKLEVMKKHNLYETLNKIKLIDNNPIFSISKQYQKNTIKILRQLLEYSEFMEGNIDDIRDKIERYFSKGVTEVNIKKLREILRESPDNKW